MTKKHTTVELLKKNNEGYPLLGHCAYFTIKEVIVHIDKVREALEKVGLDKDLVRDILPKNATARAMKKIQKEDRASGLKNARYQKIEQEGQAVFAIANPDVNTNDLTRIEYETRTTAVFDKNSKKGVFHGENKEKGEEFQDVYSNHYNHEQFSQLVRKILEKTCTAISIRQNGGMYFIPVTQEAEFEKLGKFFEAVMPGSSLDSFPIVDARQAKKAMWKSLVGDVKQDLKALSKDLQDLPKEITGKMLAGRLEKYRALSVKVEMYENVLTGTARDLKKELQALAAALKSKDLKE